MWLNYRKVRQTFPDRYTCPMPPFTQQVTFLYTPDLATTARFYEQILGLELVLDQGVCRIYRVSRDGFVGFCQKEGVAK